jgi:hypothetical protein
MTAASVKNPPMGMGIGANSNSIYSNNIPQIYARVNRLAQKWQMSREGFMRAACVWAILFRDAAPREVRALFTGRPSVFSEAAKLLALAFFLVYVEATDRIAALGSDEFVDAASCWNIAIRLAGVAV